MVRAVDRALIACDGSQAAMDTVTASKTIEAEDDGLCTSPVRATYEPS